MPDEPDGSRPKDRDDHEPPPYTPYLKIRYTVGDLTQPRTTLPPGTVFWACPDIQVSPTDSAGNVIAGTPTTVSVRVFNWGLSAAAPTAVDFFWADPSLGISAANVHQINANPVLVTVPSQQSVVVTCPEPWVPQWVNGGHECLIVQASCPLDPLIAPLLPQNDRHVGQRNLTVSGPGAKMQFQIRADNPFDERVVFALHHTAIAVRGEFERLDREEVLALAIAEDAERFEPSIMREDISHEVSLRAVVGDVVTTDERLERPRDEDHGHHAVDDPLRTARELAGADRYVGLLDRMRRSPDRVAIARTMPLAEFELGPRQTMVLRLGGRPAADSTTSVVHHITQTADGCEVGGYTVFEPSTALAEQWERARRREG